MSEAPRQRMGERPATSPGTRPGASPGTGAWGAQEISLGYSPCPNDTFVFHALVHGIVPMPGIRWRPVIEDVETLNEWALDRRLPVTKVSFHAYGHLRAEYVLLGAGSALGRGCGPLLVGRDAATDIESARIAIPGALTSAALLLRLHTPSLAAEQLVVMPFDRIVAAVAEERVDLGLIIHESRFTYRHHGLVALADLGAWWESTSGHPIPLGGIVAQRALGKERIEAIETSLRASVRHARANPADSAAYVRRHAQELDDEVTRAHIDLYVNDFTEDLGRAGREAVDALLARAEESGILPSRGPSPGDVPPSGPPR